MTTPSPEERPEPPEGYRLVTMDEKSRIGLPADALIFRDGEWHEAKSRGNLGWLIMEYATRAPLPSGETGGSEEHNPDGLTPEQYGAPGFRLLRVGEEIVPGDQADISDNGTQWREEEYSHTLKSHFICTYRRRVTPPTATVAPGDGKGEKSSFQQVWDEAVKEASPSDKDAETALWKSKVAYCQSLFIEYGLDDAAPIESHARTMVKLAKQRDNLLSLVDTLAGALETWRDYADEELSPFDEPCEAADECELCPKCKQVGCIKMKIDATRTALAAVAEFKAKQSTHD